jgi:hypothetical protein
MYFEKSNPKLSSFLVAAALLVVFSVGLSTTGYSGMSS